MFPLGVPLKMVVPKEGLPQKISKHRQACKGSYYLPGNLDFCDFFLVPRQNQTHSVSWLTTITLSSSLYANTTTTAAAAAAAATK